MFIIIIIIIIYVKYQTQGRLFHQIFKHTEKWAEKAKRSRTLNLTLLKFYLFISLFIF